MYIILSLYISTDDQTDIVIYRDIKFKYIFFVCKKGKEAWFPRHV